MNKINDFLIDDEEMRSLQQLKSNVIKHSHKLPYYKVGRIIEVNDKMQKISYKLEKPIGIWKEFPQFKPELTPDQMLTLGVFEGKYLNVCYGEFPREWFLSAIENKSLSILKPNIQKNFFKVKSRQPLDVWKENGWISDVDPRGFFQWYCRFYLGRRSDDDRRQIKRWLNFGLRHGAQVKKNCKQNDYECRPRQRQGLLQWAYDSRNY